MNYNKKILHLIDTGGQGGAEQVLVSLIEILASDQYKQYVVLPSEGWLYEKIINLDGVNVRIFNGHGRFNLNFIRFIVSYVLRNRIKIIHSHLFGTSLYASIAGFLSRVPVICTFHGYIDISSRDNLHKLKINLIGLLASRIVTVSDGLKDYLAEKLIFGKRKLETIYNGIDTNCINNITRSDARNNYGCSEDEIIIGAIGNLKPAKGYDVLLKVAKTVTSKYCNCRFFIAGNSDADIYIDLLKQREELSLESKVVFLGFQENVYTFLQMLDVFILTSKSEGFSLATIEAMNSRIPVVATRSGGPQEIITDNIDGLLADVGDYSKLAECITSIIENCELKNKIILNAEQTILSKFSSITMAKKYVINYKSICDNINS